MSSTATKIAQIARYYGTRPITKIAYVGIVGALAVGSVVIPQQIEARDVAVQQIADLRTDIATQLDMASDDMAGLTAAIDTGRGLHVTASVEDALPAENSLADLDAAIAAGDSARHSYAAQARSSRAAQGAADDSRWFPSHLAAEQTTLSDSVGALRDVRLVLPERTAALDEAIAAVAAEVADKAAADKAAAEKKAAEKAEREAAEAAAQAAPAAQTYDPPAYDAPPVSTYQAPAPGGRECAENLVAQLSGGSVAWGDLGVTGWYGAGQVLFGAGLTSTTLSSGTDPAYWCSSVGQSIAAHESAHILQEIARPRLEAAGYSFQWQLARVESAADCMAAGWGYGALQAYGCSAAGRELLALL